MIKLPRPLCARPGCGKPTRRLSGVFCGNDCRIWKYQTRPLCACGCGRRVKTGKAKHYEHACAQEARRIGGSKGGKLQGFKRQWKAFHRDVARLPRRLTKADLLDFASTMWHRGKHAEEERQRAMKRRARQGEAA